MKRVMVVLAAAILLADVGVVGARMATSKDPHRTTAESEAAHLLRLIRVPPGATIVSCSLSTVLRQPAFTPSSDHLIDRFRCWRVAMAFDAAVEWMRTHPPRGLSANLRGTGSESSSFGYEVPSRSTYRDASAQVAIAPAGNTVSLIRGDGLAVWISSTPAPDTARGPHIRITVAGGCPRTLASATDVRNDFAGRDRMMIPRDDATDGMICVYGPIGDKPPTVRRIELNAVTIRRLSRSIRRIALGSEGNFVVHGCPMDQGQVDIVVLHYRSDSDVDLWYHAAGCRTLANGSIIADWIDNPAFGDFADQVTALTGRR